MLKDIVLVTSGAQSNNSYLPLPNFVSNCTDQPLIVDFLNWIILEYCLLRINGMFYKMELNIIKDIKVYELKVFASLPDMGRVGGFASSYLAQNLKTEYIAQIISNEKPWVSYVDGVVKTVTDTYRIYYNRVL